MASVRTCSRCAPRAKRQITKRMTFERTIWKPVVGFESFYEVSSDGEILSKRFNRIMKSYPDRKGYRYIPLHDGAQKRNFAVHRIVATAFLQKYSEELQVNHKNFVRDDNRLDNLEWVTRSQNVRHAIMGRRMPARISVAPSKEDIKMIKILSSHISLRTIIREWKTISLR